MKERLRGFRVLISFGFRAAPLQATLFLVCGALMSLTGPAASYGSKLLVDAAVAGSVQQGVTAATVLALTAGLGLIVVMYYIDFLFTVVERAGAAVDQRLMVLMGGVVGLAHHEHPQYVDQLQLLREDRGRLAFMTNATAGLVRVAVQLAASAVLLATLQPVLLLLPLVGVVSFVVGKRAQDIQMRAREVTAESERLRKHIFSMATSASVGKEVRVFDLTSELLRRHHAISDAVIRAQNHAEWQSAALRAVDAVVFGVAYTAAIGLVLVRAVEGLVTPGDVVLTVGLAAGMNGIVFAAVSYGTHFLDVLKVARRYLWLEDYAQSVAEAHLDPAAVPDRLTRGIELRDVSFRYPTMEKPVLDHVSLTLPAGSVVALVGENGAGKTTLVKLLCRLYEPQDGQILVDGVDLRRIPVEGWRARLSAAFQDFVRFELLVRETVGIGHLASIENGQAVREALVRAGADDIPQSLPAGLETQLGTAWDGGMDLSGGQWQKLALGRALMRSDPLLVLFDEPTAALDAQTEHALFERFASTTRSEQNAGTITVLVSHRFSTVRMADLIVVLDQGRIVEQGSHQALMRLEGLYAEMYHLQSRAYQ